MIPDTLRVHLDTLQAVPALPMVVQALLHDIDRDSSRIDQIARLMAHDQALVARILRIANSPFYATKEPIRSVSHAIPLLGLRTVSALLLQVGLAEPAPYTKGFWLHALGTACAARAIARICTKVHADLAFTCGLLHDIGKLVITTTQPQTAAVLRNYVHQHHCLLRDAEIQILGCDHSAIGAYLAQRWRLPSECIAAIGGHHSLPNAASEHAIYAAITHLADITARALLIGNGGDNCMPVLDSTCLPLLGLDTGHLSSIFDLTEEELGLAEIFFNILDDHTETNA